MSGPKVAIIVPIYNIAKYLPACIDSVLASTYTNLEIILVDDGSTDESGKICNKCARHDKRIKVIHKTNGGLPAARRDGLAASRAKLVTFVDGDDVIHLDMIKALVETKQRFNADISTCWFKRFSNKTELAEHGEQKIYESESLTTSQAFSGWLYHSRIIPSQWGKLYDRSLFEGVEFPTMNYDEDYAMTYKLITKARKVAVTDFVGYFYRNTASSMSRSTFSADKMVGLDISEEVLNFCQEKFPECIGAAKYRIFAEAIFLITKITHQKQFVAEEKRLARAINRHKFSVALNNRAPARGRKLALTAIVIGARNLARILQKKAAHR